MRLYTWPNCIFSICIYWTKMKNSKSRNTYELSYRSNICKWKSVLQLTHSFEQKCSDHLLIKRCTFLHDEASYWNIAIALFTIYDFYRKRVSYMKASENWIIQHVTTINLHAIFNQFCVKVIPEVFAIFDSSVNRHITFSTHSYS